MNGATRGASMHIDGMVDGARGKVNSADEYIASSLVSNTQKWIEEIKHRTRDSSQGVHEKAENLKAK